MSTARPLRADARRNRDALVSAARAAFDRGEFNRRFDDFAALAGVGVGTLYRHFPTRDALAVAVYDEEVSALSQHAQRLLADLLPAEALATFLRDFVRRLAAHDGLAQTLALLLRQQPDAQTDGARVLEQAVARLVTAAAREGAVRHDVTTGVIMTTLHGIGSSYGRPDWQDDADALIDLVVRPNPQKALVVEVADGTHSATPRPLG